MTLAEVDGLIERILLTNSQRFTQLVGFICSFKLLQAKNNFQFFKVTASDIKALCNSAIEVLRVQPSLVEIDPPVVVCGDIHGQFSDLMRIFSRVGFPPLKNFLFLGGKGPTTFLLAFLTNFRRLRRPRPSKHRDSCPASGLQDKISGKFLPVARQP